MKIVYILSTLLFFSLCTTAQVAKDSSSMNESSLEEAEDSIFEMVEVEAQFPGGDIGWVKYLSENIDAEVPIRKKAKRGKYPVVIRFIVNKYGEISDVKGETRFGHGMEQEAIRVIKSGPKWMPAVQDGRKVNAYRRQPITFVVE